MHLGGNASVLQQHSGPHRWVTSHKLPVPADLGSSQQGFSIQVGEDTEESGAHLEDLWTDHLVGSGWALFMAAGLVDPLRTTCAKIKALTQWRRSIQDLTVDGFGGIKLVYLQGLGIVGYKMRD